MCGQRHFKSGQPLQDQIEVVWVISHPLKRDEAVKQFWRPMIARFNCQLVDKGPILPELMLWNLLPSSSLQQRILQTTKYVLKTGIAVA
jgi:hypothetical protein